MAFLAWLEQTSLSHFVREDFYAYFVLLIFHALGMAFLIGTGLAIGLRVLGVAGGVRLDRFAAFLPAMGFGAALAIPSGIGLLIGYPAKALTNWIFPLKLIILALAALMVWQLVTKAFPLAARGEPLPRWSRPAALAAVALWLAGVAAGKLLLYTNIMLLTTD